MINVTHTGVSNVQSYTYIIREMFLAKVATLDFFEGFHIRRTKLAQIQPERFVHQARLGFSVICLNNDEAQLEATLDAAFWAIMNGLWRDEYVMSFQDTWNPHTQIATSITSGLRASRAASAGMSTARRS